VLSPTKRPGLPCSTVALNRRLQPVLNPAARRTADSDSDSAKQPRLHWLKGDRVLHLQNDPERDASNGDLGVIDDVLWNNMGLVVRYPPRSSKQDYNSYSDDWEEDDSDDWHSSSSSSSSRKKKKKESMVVKSNRKGHWVKYDQVELGTVLQHAWSMTVHKVKPAGHLLGEMYAIMVVLVCYIQFLVACRDVH
jgi:ATP-dependent exoDNAse (exonuclease V) alpha subunit